MPVPAKPDEVERISVCICSYRRPELLARLLSSIAGQRQAPAFRLEVIVSDNDRDRSAEPVVKRFVEECGMQVTYVCEPDRNISLARNLAISVASGNLVALIDDDECPVEDWLHRMHSALMEHSADGVLGPVVPDFPPGAPGWLIEGRFFERRRLATGTRISERDARTGNLLLKRSIFTRRDGWFDPAFGRTGGEDSDFFRRQFSIGSVFVWCDEAVASETVPPDRWTAMFQIRKYLRSGTIDGELMRGRSVPVLGPLVRSILFVLGGIAVAPFTVLLRKHIRVRAWRKLAYSGGLLAAFGGVSLLRERD
jgi:glycosyltransferase involved in cell wall biosynthesis